MYPRLSNLVSEFPRQFWVLFGGTLVNGIGSGMVFPFLTLYLYQHLAISMTYVGALLAVWFGSSLVGGLIGGSLSDQFGRKRLMALSLLLGALLIPLFGLADSLFSALGIIMAAGVSTAMYQPARDAMIADLVEQDKRAQAYSLIRIVSNLGIAIGPAVGGFLASRSYMLSFLLCAAASFVFFVAVLTLTQETQPLTRSAHARQAGVGGLANVLHDGLFVLFCLALAVTTIAYAPMMTVLPVYMKEQFALGETFFGWVMTTNAGLVVLLQYPITRATARFFRFGLIAAGSVLYGLGIASVWLGTKFPHFVLAMAVMTMGEMLVSPNMVAVTADLAPSSLRGSYMGVLGLVVSVGFGLGPLIGGVINDQVAPRAVWPMMGLTAIAVALVYLLIGRRMVPLRAARTTLSA